MSVAIYIYLIIRNRNERVNFFRAFSMLQHSAEFQTAYTEIYCHTDPLPILLGVACSEMADLPHTPSSPRKLLRLASEIVHTEVARLKKGTRISDVHYRVSVFALFGLFKTFENSKSCCLTSFLYFLCISYVFRFVYKY